MSHERICCCRFPTGAILPVALTALVVSEGCVDIRVPDPGVRYVAFGDSTTVGPSPRNYPDILRELLVEPAETFANQGHGGETTKEGLERLTDLLEADMFPNAEVWLYWEGGNDLIEFIQAHDPLLQLSPDDPDYPFADDLTRQLTETQANIESAIALLHGTGGRLYVATYFFVRENLSRCPPLPLDVLLPLQADRANAYIVRLNERILTAVNNRNGILVEVATRSEELRADPANYFDCNHLSEQGNEIAAAAFADAIATSGN
jgi:lysophospholipase L1-like esterase